MHEIQLKIYNLSTTRGIAGLSLRELGELIGEPHPQKIKHHLEQLKKKGLLRYKGNTGFLEPVKQGFSVDSKLVNIPILGSANCGQANIFAGENYEGFLKVAQSVLGVDLVKKQKNLFAIKAVGDSMNNAKRPVGPIESGDYVVVDTKDQSPRDGDYVLSVIDGMANIKKFVKDKINNQIVLISESTIEYPPIIIDENISYYVNGKVLKVIKKPIG